MGFVTQWFEPEPVTNPLWIAEALQSHGLAVGVATGIPNYPSGKIQSPYRAYRRYIERWNGVTVIRTPLYPSHDRSASRRAVNYLSFAASSAIGAHPILGHSDVNLVYASPATAALPAMVAAKRMRVPYVLYIQDLWPDSVKETGMLPPGRFTSLGVTGLTRFVNASYTHAAHIVVISQGMRETLVDRGVNPEKVSVIHNWAGEESPPSAEEVSAARSSLGVNEEEILVMYAGNHGEAQNLSYFIQAIRNVSDIPELRFVFMGEGSQKKMLQSLAVGIPRDRLQFLPGVHPDKVAAFVAAADVQIVSLADDPIFEITIPGKVQANLAAGKALVAAVSGDSAALLGDSGAAFVIHPGDPTAIEAAMRKLPSVGRHGLVSMGNKGRIFYHQVFGRQQGSRRLVSVLQNAVKASAQ